MKLMPKYDIHGVGWTERPLFDKEFEAHEKLIALNEGLMQSFNSKLIYKPRLTDLQREFLKSSIRSIVRYSDEAKNFAKTTTSILLDDNPNDQSIKNLYITPPYLIFHQPRDLYEKGPFHVDKIKGCGKMFTWWTPINERQLSYPALTILEGSHKFLPHCLEMLSRKTLPRSFQDGVLSKLFGGTKTRHLIPNKKSSYFWDSYLIHRGNENEENLPHCALVFRISTLPLYYEPANNLLDISLCEIQSNAQVNLDDIFNILLSIEEHVNSMPTLTLTDNSLISLIRDFRIKTLCVSPFLKKHVCFALTLISQRFPHDKLSPIFNLMSYLLGNENLVGLERFLKMHSSKSKLNKVIKILVDEGFLFESYQENLLLKGLGIELKDQYSSRHKFIKITGWL